MAAECYGKKNNLNNNILAKLSEHYPQYVDYKLYHAQSLYNAFLFPEAVAVLLQVKEKFI